MKVISLKIKFYELKFKFCFTNKQKLSCEQTLDKLGFQSSFEKDQSFKDIWIEHGWILSFFITLLTVLYLVKKLY